VDTKGGGHDDELELATRYASAVDAVRVDAFTFAQRREVTHGTFRGRSGLWSRLSGESILRDEFIAEFNNAREQTEQDVRVQTTLVRLIDDDHTILAQQEVMLDLFEQNTFGHHLDLRVALDLAVVTDLISNQSGTFSVELLRYTLGGRHGCDTTRLCHSDHTIATVACLVQELRHLGGFSGTCFTREDEDVVVGDRFHDLLLLAADRQLQARVLREREG